MNNNKYAMRSKPLARALIGATLVLFNAHSKAAGNGGPGWTRNYFPNVPLITDEGRRVRFFDDLIKGKVVAIHFMSTRCAHSCRRETARLKALEEILGERVGRDIFLYSISIDPVHGTSSVATTYRGQLRHASGWTFLTGERARISVLQRKLGLSREAAPDGSKDRSPRLIIGNQASGRWMKRSPLEDPHILAAALGDALDHGEDPRRGHNDHAWDAKLPAWLRPGLAEADVMLAENMPPAERLAEDRNTPPDPPLHDASASATRSAISIGPHTG